MLFRRVDDAGFFVEDVILDEHPIVTETVQQKQIYSEGIEILVPVEVPLLDADGFTILDPHYVATPCQGGFYRPKWNGTAWVEGGQVPAPQPWEPTAEERITALENALLTMMGGVPNV